MRLQVMAAPALQSPVRLFLVSAPYSVRSGQLIAYRPSLGIVPVAVGRRPTRVR